MRDAIGNTIKEGDLLNWAIPKDATRTLVNVTRVSEGGLSTGAGDATTMPVLVVTMVINVEGVQPGREAILHDFLCVRDPRSEALLDKVTGGSGKAS